MKIMTYFEIADSNVFLHNCFNFTYDALSKFLPPILHICSNNSIYF